ncbi:unnamed protein product [Paramecium pentaurelia]|uniref:Uncharacterized protein n=1 Tax=Paramecium pentaurelia TaxID=43138 RepID=A0A8S1TV62_9CILI|nr:unnamed protein product [Paramecium pentaurelia]
MEIIPVETKKRIHEFSYAQKVSNQMSPDKSHIKLNESLFKAQILEKQSCTLIRNIQKDLMMKIKKYDSLLKKSNTQKNISSSQPTSPPIWKKQEEFQEEYQEDTQLQNQIKPRGEKLLTEIVHQTIPNDIRKESFPIKKLDVKLSNFQEEKALFSSQDISPIKQEQNNNKLYLRRNTTQNTATPKQKKSSVTDFLGSYAKLHVSKSTSTKKPNLIESKNQVLTTKETKEIKQNDNKKLQSTNKKQSETTDYTFRQKKIEIPVDKQNRIKKNQKQKQSVDLCVNTDLKEIIHIINDLDLFNNRLKKKL